MARREHRRGHREHEHRVHELPLEVLGHGSSPHLLIQGVLLFAVVVGQEAQLVLVEIHDVRVLCGSRQSIFGFFFSGEANEPEVGLQRELGIHGFALFDCDGGDIPVELEGIGKIYFCDILSQVFSEEVGLIEDVCKGLSELASPCFLLLRESDEELLV